MIGESLSFKGVPNIERSNTLHCNWTTGYFRAIMIVYCTLLSDFDCVLAAVTNVGVTLV